MSNKLALDALITALACLLPEPNLDHQIQLNTHRAFYDDNPRLFCDVRNHLNENFKNFEMQNEENQRQLLKLQLKMLQLAEKINKNTAFTDLPSPTCKGLEDGIYKFISDSGIKPFYTACKDQKILILQHYGANKPKNITTEKALKGFGVLYDDFFLGLEQISLLTKHGCCEAQVTVKNLEYETIYAFYTEFKVIKNKSFKYTMEVSGCRGDACDILGKPKKRLNVKKNCMELENTRHWWDFSCDENAFVEVYLNPSDSENCNRNNIN